MPTGCKSCGVQYVVALRPQFPFGFCEISHIVGSFKSANRTTDVYFHKRVRCFCYSSLGAHSCSLSTAPVLYLSVKSIPSSFAFAFISSMLRHGLQCTSLLHLWQSMMPLRIDCPSSGNRASGRTWCNSIASYSNGCPQCGQRPPCLSYSLRLFSTQWSCTLFPYIKSRIGRFFILQFEM